jgi:hypothetical protein
MSELPELRPRDTVAHDPNRPVPLADTEAVGDRAGETAGASPGARSAAGRARAGLARRRRHPRRQTRPGRVDRGCYGIRGDRIPARAAATEHRGPGGPWSDAGNGWFQKPSTRLA